MTTLAKPPGLLSLVAPIACTITGRSSQASRVVDPVRARPVGRVDGLKAVAEDLETFLVEASRLVVEALGERPPQVIVDRCSRELLDGGAGVLAEGVVVHLGPGVADHREPVREQAADGEVVDRGQELALREVARRPVDHEDRRLGGAAHPEARAKRIRGRPLGRRCHQAAR
jgi:hypothetical protein